MTERLDAGLLFEPSPQRRRDDRAEKAYDRADDRCGNYDQDVF